MQVHVAADGKATKVDILKASEPAFANHAISCAMARLYEPAHDSQGQPIAGVTDPITLRFLPMQ